MKLNIEALGKQEIMAMAFHQGLLKVIRRNILHVYISLSSLPLFTQYKLKDYNLMKLVIKEVTTDPMQK